MTVWKVFVRGIAEEDQAGLRLRLPVRQGMEFNDALLETTRAAAKEFDPRLEVMVNPAVPSEAYVRIPAEIRARIGPAPEGPAVNVTIYRPDRLPRRIRVVSRTQETMLLERAMPRGAGKGVVQLAVIVAQDGHVAEIAPLGGPETLVEPAIQSVWQWKYRPTLLNGLPVEVQTTVDVHFASA